MTNNSYINNWIKEMAELTTPDNIVWIDGSEEQTKALQEQAVKDGTLEALNPDLLPNCFLHRTAVNDVARVENRTFICTREKADAGNINNWMDPKECYDKLGKLFRGSMKGILPELFTCTQKYGAINLLGGKKSISGDEYKGLKVVFSDFQAVGKEGVNIIVGVKAADYSTSYKCDPVQYAGLSGDGEMVVTFNETFKGKNIDLLDLQGLAPGVEISLKKVYLIKNDDSLEEVPFSISFGWNKSVVGKAAYADPIIVFPGQYSLITVSTDENGTLATFDVNSGEKQEYIVEFEEPTTAGLNLGCNTDVKDETVTWDAKIALYFPVEPGSSKASCVISKDNVLAKTDKATKVISVFLQNTDSKAQTVKIKSIKRVTTTATGISKVENLKVAQDGKCFNLAGQQVGKGYKGIVIKNGKKMVIK